MAGVAGTGTVIDVATIVSQLMSVERVPVQKLDTQIKATNAKITAYGTIKSKLSALQAAARALSTGFDVAKNSIKATASDPTAVDVSVTGSTAVTSRQITVNQMASRQRLQSNMVTDTTVDLGLTSTLQIEVGEWSGTSFAPNAAKTPKTIDLTGKSLTQVASAINAAGAGVSARIEGPAGASRLVIESTSDGSQSGFRISNTDPTSTEMDFVYDRASGAMTETVPAANASVTVDGATYSSQSNVFTSAIPGVSLTVKSKPASPITLTTAVDATLLKGKLDTFVAAYNDLLAYTKKVAPTGIDGTGDLKNDSSVPSILRTMRGAITSATGPADMATLNRLGVRFEQDGTLSVKQADLEAAVGQNYDGVVGLLTGANGATGSVMRKVADTIGDLLGAKGVIGAKNESLQSMSRRQSERRTALAERLPAIEKQYLLRYSTLDAKLSGMQQQLASVKSALVGVTAQQNQN